jgi:hypothetical protein
MHWPHLRIENCDAPRRGQRAVSATQI